MKATIDVPEMPLPIKGESDDPANEVAFTAEDGKLLIMSTDWITHYQPKRLRSGRVVLVEVGAEKAYR